MYQSTGYYEVSVRNEKDGVIIASITHYGEYAYLHEAYDFLLSWIERNGYRPAEREPLGVRYCIKETYIKDSHNTELPEGFETLLTARLAKKEEAV